MPACTLWSGDVLLGEVSAISGASERTIEGFFHPSPNCATAGAPLLSVATDGLALALQLRGNMPDVAELDVLPEDERAQRIRTALLENPATQRLVELQSAVRALHLELRDERGEAIAASDIGVMRVPLPEGVSAGDLREIGGGGTFSEFMLTATRG